MNLRILEFLVGCILEKHGKLNIENNFFYSFPFHEAAPPNPNGSNV
jgi:hypothetical protein